MYAGARACVHHHVYKMSMQAVLLCVHIGTCVHMHRQVLYMCEYTVQMCGYMCADVGYVCAGEWVNVQVWGVLVCRCGGTLCGAGLCVQVCEYVCASLWVHTYKCEGTCVQVF